MTPIKLSEYAKSIGMDYRAALRRFHNGTLGVEAVQLENRTVLVYPTNYSTAYATVRRLPRDDQMKLATEIMDRGGID